MKLWRISQTETGGYDTYDSAVVAASSEAAARGIFPSEWGTWNDTYPVWATSPDRVKAEYLGEAREGYAAGVVVASFNAG